MNSQVTYTWFDKLKQFTFRKKKKKFGGGDFNKIVSPTEIGQISIFWSVFLFKFESLQGHFFHFA